MNNPWTSDANRRLQNLRAHLAALADDLTLWVCEHSTCGDDCPLCQAVDMDDLTAVLEGAALMMATAAKVIATETTDPTETAELFRQVGPRPRRPHQPRRLCGCRP